MNLSLDALTPEKSDTLVYVMYFLPMFEMAYIYYERETVFNFVLLIIASIIIVLMESYHFAYITTVSPEENKVLSKKIENMPKKVVKSNVSQTIQSVKPFSGWYIFVTFLWILLYIFVCVILFQQTDTNMNLLGIFHISLFLFITLKAYFTIKFLKNKNVTVSKRA